MSRITLPGAVFLTFIALLPVFIADQINVPFRFGGTSLLIVVGVALDTITNMNQHLLLRKYDGFMKKGGRCAQGVASGRRPAASERGAGCRAPETARHHRRAARDRRAPARARKASGSSSRPRHPQGRDGRCAARCRTRRHPAGTRGQGVHGSWRPRPGRRHPRDHEGCAVPAVGRARRDPRRRRAHGPAGRGPAAAPWPTSDASRSRSCWCSTIDDDELVRRISERTVCESCQTPYTGHAPGSACPKCGGRLVRRTDDEPEAVRQRLAVYRAQTAPVISGTRRTGHRFYRSMRSARRTRSVSASSARWPADAVIERCPAIDSAVTTLMIQLKSAREIEIMAQGGRILGETHPPAGRARRARRHDRRARRARR